MKRAVKTAPEGDKNPCSGVNIGSSFTDEEREFLVAMQQWMAVTRTRYPSFTQVLAVAKSIGYRKRKVKVAC